MSLRPRRRPIRPIPRFQEPRQTFTGRVIVRLDPDTLNGIEASFAPVRALTLREIGERFARSQLVELLDALEDPFTARVIHGWTIQETKAKEEQVGARSAAGYQSLNAFFSVDLPDRPLPALIDAVRRFRRVPEVTAAFVEPAVSLAAPVTPDEHTDLVGFWPGQGYVFGDHAKDSERSGINAKCVWDTYDGSGVRLVVLEHGWKVDHPELPHPGGNPLPLLDGAMLNVLVGRDHGTNTLGVIAAKDHPGEGFGIVGIAPEVEIPGLASFEYSTTSKWEIVEAIRASIDVLGPGDVLLLEVQTDKTVVIGGVTLPDGYPLEIVDHWLNAIRLAHLHGITVIEPAGNPGSNAYPYNLDKAQWTPIGGNPRSLDPSDATFIDSGAIMVGECEPVPVADDLHNRSSSAWYGGRIDCYAWGEEVLTTACYGYDFTGAAAKNTCPDSKAAEALYGEFTGTSSASAIIAGAVVLMQQMYRKKRNGPASPDQIRAILRDTTLGTPIGDIGSTVAAMPDLCRIEQALDLTPDIYVRDSLADVGAVPSPVVSMSPDVFVLSSPLNLSNPGSPYDDRTKFVPNDLVVPAADNHVYVRISNLAPTADAQGCQAIVYWTPPSTLLVPQDWREIGWMPAPVNVAAGAQAIAGPLVWRPTPTDLPFGGHGCFIAMVDHPKDPRPVSVPATVTWAEFLALIGNSNNLAWKNFNVIPTSPTSSSSLQPGGQWAGLPFQMRGVPDRPMEFDFAIIPHLPDGSRVYWRMPRAAHDTLRAAGLPAEIEVVAADEERVVLALPDGRPLHLTGVALPADARIRMTFGVSAGTRFKDDEPGLLQIRQYYDRGEVGRITWSFVRRSDDGSAA